MDIEIITVRLVLICMLQSLCDPILQAKYSTKIVQSKTASFAPAIGFLKLFMVIIVVYLQERLFLSVIVLSS